MARIAIGEQGRYAGLIRVIMQLLAALILVLVVVGVTVWRTPLWLTSKLAQAQLYRAGVHNYSMIVDGEKVHYIEGGTGDPVVLVHGLGTDARQHWAFLTRYLIPGGHHVYAMDLLGFGESARPTDREYSIVEQARLVEAFLDAEHLDKVVLAGGSMGGWIAATVALDQPQRVTRLVLFDSLGMSFKQNFDSALFTPETKEQLDRLMALMTPNPPPMPNSVKEAIIRSVKQNGWVVKRTVASMRTGADLLDHNFSSLKMPLLIVWGKQDVLVPLSVGEAMHQAAPQSILEIYDGCGHTAVVTCVDRIVPGVLDFLTGSGPPPGTIIEVPTE
jgi:pimeloyl-ACP methyl ester carboxylesterase